LSDVSSTLALLMDSSSFHGDFSRSFSWISQRQPIRFCDGYDIFQVLQWVRCRNCLDDKDRIFALLGLQYNARYPWNSVVRNIEPDYSRSADNLYMGLACDISKLGVTLRILNAVHHGSYLRAWEEGIEPSWVPCWNEQLTSEMEHQDLRGYWSGNNMQTKDCLFYPVSVDLRRKSMIVKCVRYDKIGSILELPLECG
jgi:hypothetical protein